MRVRAHGPAHLMGKGLTMIQFVGWRGRVCALASGIALSLALSSARAHEAPEHDPPSGHSMPAPEHSEHATPPQDHSRHAPAAAHDHSGHTPTGAKKEDSKKPNKHRGHPASHGAIQHGTHARKDGHAQH